MKRELTRGEMKVEEELHSPPRDLDEKILTISATEYVAMVGKSLSDYIPLYIESEVTGWSASPALFLSRSAPEGTEAVVNYKVITLMGSTVPGTVSPVTGVQYGIGTALVPKKKE